MANSHVPKFGNWENEDIPYTAYFENARKDKPVGNVKINPNDPEENPEAFMMMMMMQRRGSSRSLEGNNSSHHNPDSSVPQTAAVQPPRSLMKSASTEKSRHTDEHTRYREHHAHHRNGIADTNTNYSSTNTTTLGNNHKSPASESGSDQKTSSDYSLLDRPNQGRYVRSDDYKKKTSTTSSGRGSDSSSSASEQGHHRRQRSSSTNHSSDHQEHHHRAASIPKFGSWDVNDPKSGEGFTVIFDRIKEEKQNNGAIEVPTMLPPRPPTNHLKDRSKRSCVSKICCCMSSSGSE